MTGKALKFKPGQTYKANGFKMTVTRRNEKSVWYTGNLYDDKEHRAKIADLFKDAESVSLPWAVFHAVPEMEVA